MDSWCVYVHIFPNTKRYFGITKQEPENRWLNGKGYLKGGNSNSAMANAIRKYGWKNVKHQILFDGLTLEEANWLERWFISTYKTNVCRYGTEFGYNSTDGGDGNSGHIQSAEARERMSKAKKGRPTSGRAVICDGVEYQSVAACARAVGEKRERLKQWLNGKNNMPIEWFERGLRYIDGQTDIKIQEVPHMRAIVFNGVVYESISSFARIVDDDFRNISAYLTGYRKMPQKYVDGNLRYYIKAKNHK